MAQGGIKARGTHAAVIPTSKVRQVGLPEPQRWNEFVAQATETLFSNKDTRAALTAVAEAALPQLADRVIVHFVEGGHAKIAAIATPPGSKDVARRHEESFPITLDGPSPIAQAIRTGRPRLVIGAPANEELRGAARGPEHMRALQDLKIGSMLIMPLSNGTTPIGTVTFIRAKDRAGFTQDELGHVEELARRAAVIVERAPRDRSVRVARGQLDAILQSIADGLTVLGRDDRFLYANEAAAQLFGFARPEELVRLSHEQLAGRFDVFDEAGAPVRTEQLPNRLALEGRTLRNVLLRYRSKASSREVLALVSAAPVLDEDGKVLYAVNVFRDVSERLNLGRARILLASIVDSSDDAIASKNLNGIVTSWNPAAERIFGWTAGEMVGRPITTIIPPDLRSDEERILERIRRGERVEHFETVRQHKDGRLIDVSISVSPLLDENGIIIGASKIARDVTDRKQQQEELARLNLELEDRVRQRTQALETAVRELESFNYAVSHDLRTPLRAISGFASLALKETEAGTSMSKYLEFIMSASEEMSRITEALLRLSKIGDAGVRRSAVDLAALARESVAKLISADPGRKVVVEVPRTLPVSADPAMMRSVMDNLIGNSWKFTGTIAGPRIEVGVEQRGDRPWIYVKDNGVGFSRADADGLFQPFRRLRPDEFPGTGVGLATAKKIIEAHGGRIEAEGRPGLGATFRFTLPA